MTGDVTIRSMLALCTAILTAAALYLARSLLAPVAFSIFAMTVVWPFQRTLQARMPKLLALLLTLLLTLLVLGVLALATAWGSSQVGQWLFRNADRFQFIYARTNEWLEGHGIFASTMLADRLDVSWLAGVAQEVAAALSSMVGFVLLVFAFTILGLMEVDGVQKRIEQLESVGGGPPRGRQRRRAPPAASRGRIELNLSPISISRNEWEYRLVADRFQTSKGRKHETEQFGDRFDRHGARNRGLLSPSGNQCTYFGLSKRPRQGCLH
jgi:hypothetical protein